MKTLFVVLISYHIFEDFQCLKPFESFGYEDFSALRQTWKTSKEVFLHLMYQKTSRMSHLGGADGSLYKCGLLQGENLNIRLSNISTINILIEEQHVKTHQIIAFPRIPRLPKSQKTYFSSVGASHGFQIGKVDERDCHLSIR